MSRKYIILLLKDLWSEKNMIGIYQISRKNVKTKGIQQETRVHCKAKLKRLGSTGKKYTSRANKNSEYVTLRKKQRNSKNFLLIYRIW